MTKQTEAVYFAIALLMTVLMFTAFIKTAHYKSVAYSQAVYIEQLERRPTIKHEQGRVIWDLWKGLEECRYREG